MMEDKTPRLIKLEEKMAAEGGTYDTAKPQPWLDQMSERGYDYETLRVGIVWFYSPKYYFGEAYPITDEAAAILEDASAEIQPLSDFPS